jgi:hypothetical protein
MISIADWCFVGLGIGSNVCYCYKERSQFAGAIQIRGRTSFVRRQGSKGLAQKETKLGAASDENNCLAQTHF